MSNTHKEKNEQLHTLNNLLGTNKITVLDKIVEENEKLTTNQKEFGNNIEMMDTITRNNNSARDSQYRSRIALILTISFITLAGAIVILTPIYNATFGKETQIDQYRLFELFNSVFGTILGFVLGYYFKDRSNGNKNNG